MHDDPPSFWAEAISTANYLRNRCTSESIDGETPFKLWTGKRPTLTHLRPFGTKALVLDKSQQRGKFEPKSKECILIGYSEESKAYRLWLTEDKKVIRSRDVKFMNTFQPEENGTISTTDHNSLLDPFAEEGEVSRSNPIAEEGEASQSNPIIEGGEASEPCPKPNMKRGPGRPRNVKTGNRGRPCKKYQMVPADSNVEVEPDDEAAGLVKHLDSASAEIIADPYADEWKEAILDEYAAHIVNQTWEIVDYPSSRKPIGSRFVLKTKFKENGDIERRKARLVAKGYAQRPGTDFQETFAPVARISSIRMLMALSAEWNLTVHQMDVVTAYLNGEVEEELFMEIPEQLEESLSDIMNKEHVNDRIMDTARKWLNLLQSGMQKA